MKHATFKAIVLVLSVSGPTLACEPKGVAPKNAAEAFSMAPIVFTGKVKQAYQDNFGNKSIVDVAIINYWKGGEWLTPTSRVDSSAGPTCPVHIFSEGGTYLFYITPLLPQQRGNFKADGYVDRVLEETLAADDFKFLSAHKEFKIGGRTTGSGVFN